MLTTVDQLEAGQQYFLPEQLTLTLIERGQAFEVGPRKTFEVQKVTPQETKPIEPTAKQVVSVRVEPDEAKVVGMVNRAIRKGRKRG